MYVCIIQSSFVSRMMGSYLINPSRRIQRKERRSKEKERKGETPFIIIDFEPHERKEKD